jgi:hypothetical protein
MDLSLVRKPGGWLRMFNLRNDVGYKTSFGGCCGVRQESVDHQSDESLPAVVHGMKRETFLIQVKQHILLLMPDSN